MRSAILLAALSVLIFSCRTDKDEPYRGSCFGGCTDADRMVKIDTRNTNLTKDSLSGRLVRKFLKDNTFSTLLEESAPADTFFITGENDYEIYYPAINKSIRISGLTFLATGLPDTCNATGYCVNPIDTVLVTFNGVPQQYNDDFYYTNLKSLYITLQQ